MVLWRYVTRLNTIVATASAGASFAVALLSLCCYLLEGEFRNSAVEKRSKMVELVSCERKNIRQKLQEGGVLQTEEVGRRNSRGFV